MPSRRSGVPVTLKSQADNVGRGQHGRHFQPTHHAVGQRNHEDQERHGKGRGSHPCRAQEQKPTSRDNAHEGKRHHGELVVHAQAATERNSCGGGGQADPSHHHRSANRAAIRPPQQSSPGIEQVTGDERHQRDVGMQLAVNGVRHQPSDRLDEEERCHNNIANQPPKSRSLRTWQAPPRGPRTSARRDEGTRHGFFTSGFHCVRILAFSPYRATANRSSTPRPFRRSRDRRVHHAASRRRLR